jgi:hypothetical protein
MRGRQSASGYPLPTSQNSQALTAVSPLSNFAVAQFSAAPTIQTLHLIATLTSLALRHPSISTS